MKKFNLLITILMSLLLLFIISCGDIGSTSGSITSPTETTYSGKLEKGAFQQGAEIIAYGWDAATGYTGESFITQTTDDLGNYELKSSKIKDMLYIKAEGYFFNENTGLISDSTLKLYGVIDSAKQPWNINVLTHIIKNRVITLLETGSDYDASVNQAITELFTGLNWAPLDPGTQSVANNPQLLFLSAAICKSRTVAEVSSLLTTLATDLNDGIVDLSILDDSFYDVNVSEVETNMLELYGSTPSIQTVKDQVIAYRGITGPAPKVFTFDAISGYDFFYVTQSNNVKALDSTTKLIVTVNTTCLITQAGFPDKIVSVSFQDFYTVSGVIYYKAFVDNEVQYVKQEGTTVTVITQGAMPTKPVKSRVTLSHADFQIITNSYEGTPVSDLTVTNSGGGIIRNLLLTDYFIGYRAGTNYGIYYVAVDEEAIVRQSGLYFVFDGSTSTTSIIPEKGMMWKL